MHNCKKIAVQSITDEVKRMQNYIFIRLWIKYPSLLELIVVASNIYVRCEQTTGNRIFWLWKEILRGKYPEFRAGAKTIMINGVFNSHNSNKNSKYAFRVLMDSRIYKSNIFIASFIWQKGS